MKEKKDEACSCIASASKIFASCSIGSPARRSIMRVVDPWNLDLIHAYAEIATFITAATLCFTIFAISRLLR